MHPLVGRVNSGPCGSSYNTDVLCEDRERRAPPPVHRALPVPSALARRGAAERDVAVPGRGGRLSVRGRFSAGFAASGVVVRRLRRAARATPPRRTRPGPHTRTRRTEASDRVRESSRVPQTKARAADGVRTTAGNARAVRRGRRWRLRWWVGVSRGRSRRTAATSAGRTASRRIGSSSGRARKGAAARVPRGEGTRAAAVFTSARCRRLRRGLSRSGASGPGRSGPRRRR